MLIGITIAATLFEGFGVAMLFPIMDFIERGKNFEVLEESSRMWTYISKFFDVFSIPKTLIALMLIVFILLLVRQLFLFVKRVYSKWITEGILSDIRSMGFEWFVKADIRFFDSYGVGQLINVLTVDGVRAGGGIFTFFNLLAASLIFLFYLAFLLVLAPGMTFFAISIMACVGFILKSRIRKSNRIGNELSRHNERISSAIVERLSGIRLLKLCATENREVKHIKGLSEKIKTNSYSLGIIAATMELAVDPMVIFAGLVILYFSVEVFHMSLARTGIFVFVLLRLMPYTKDIFNSRQELAGVSGSLFRVKDTLESAQHARQITGGGIESLEIRKGISFKRVGFSYSPDDDFALEDVDLVIPAGKMTALVGRSGAGKSSLVDLIPRLRVPSKGEITIDGTPLENFNLNSLRRSIAFVSQEGFLFNDTIEENIRYARPEASHEDVVRAAETAYADHFIRQFPKGYETLVGERGVKLSGGQRQRIILARALLQEASIIILDEPTSALDSESEKNIQQAMDKIREVGEITMIIIAHRLSTVRQADQIVVLEKGRVVETGTHGVLMHEDSWYADMVRMQSLDGGTAQAGKDE